MHSFCYAQKSNVNNNLYLIPKSLYLVILYNQNILGKYTSYLKPLTGPLYTTMQPIHNYIAYTQLYSLYIVSLNMYYTAYTQLYSLYTTIQPIHSYTAYTQQNSLYTTIKPIHNNAAYSQLYSLFATIQPIHNYTQPIHNYKAYTHYTAYTHVQSAPHVTTRPIWLELNR